MKSLSKISKKNKNIHVESGNLIREFSKGKTYTEKNTKAVMEKGLLIPEAVIVSLWMGYLNDKFTGKEYLFFDGTPRKLREAQLLNDALEFYDIKKPIVVLINVSKKWSEERLMGRARKDDNLAAVKKRLAWYETEVVPTIKYYKNSSHYHCVNVNGEQSIEDVHKEVLTKLDLKS